MFSMCYFDKFLEKRKQVRGPTQCNVKILKCMYTLYILTYQNGYFRTTYINVPDKLLQQLILNVN